MIEEKTRGICCHLNVYVCFLDVGHGESESWGDVAD